MKVLSYALDVLIVLVLATFLSLWAAIFLNSAPLTGEPGFFARSKIYLSENSASTDRNSPRQELRPVHYGIPADKLYQASLAAVRSMGWELTSSNASRREIKARIRSVLFGLKSDITIQVQALGKDKSTLAVSSRSQQNYGDLGRNTNNILRLYQTLDTLYPTHALD